MKELTFIDYITKIFKTKKPVVKGIGDDCAIIDYTKGKYLLLTCDMIAEGVHFTEKTPPYKIGRKAMAVNISDIASMGGVCKYALISAGIPRKKGTKFLKEIIKGIRDISREFNIQIIGGDTNSSSKVVINVTLIGEVLKKDVVRRSGAKVGDLIFVTGILGEGKKKHLNFIPRIKEAKILVKNFKINSMIDLSDGLSVDLNRIAKESRVGARIYKSLIPLPDKDASIDKSIYEGEDFELLFTASKSESKRIIKRMGKKEDLPISLIGEVVNKKSGVKLIEEEGKSRALKPKGYEHL